MACQLIDISEAKNESPCTVFIYIFFTIHVYYYYYYYKQWHIKKKNREKNLTNRTIYKLTNVSCQMLQKILHV